MKINHKYYFTLTIIFASLHFVIGQNIWTQKANFGGGNRWETVGFSIGTKGYFAIGDSFQDLWEYDPTSNVWTQKANFGGSGTSETISFVIGNKAYIGEGMGAATSGNDFWEYDQATNIWTQKTSWGVWLEDHSAFSIGNKGYICGGWDGGQIRSELREYDTLTDTWTLKANIPNAKWAAVTFTIGNFAYMGTGFDSTSGASGASKDFWKYDPSIDTWTQISDFGGSPRREAVAFTINGKGYVGTGISGSTFYNDFWEYTPATDSWVQVADLTTTGRAIAGSFAIGNKGYAGTGMDSAGNSFQDFWEFSPPLNIGINEIKGKDLINIFPNPFSLQTTITFAEEQKHTIIKITDVLGKEIKTVIFTGRQFVLDKAELKAGIYFVQTTDEQKYVSKTKIVIE